MNNHAILLIPDARMRGLFSLLFADSETQVTSCSGNEEFQRALTAKFYNICALVLDHGVDMEAMVKSIRTLSPNTKIVLIANKDDLEQIIPLFPLGLSEVLLQPINPKRAITVINKLLEASWVSAKAAVSEPQVGDQSIAGGNATPCLAHHVVARSAAMHKVVEQLWRARQDPLGIILSGEAGTEFELLAREYQQICGDSSGYLQVLSHHEVTTEGLATVTSLDRLSDGAPRIFLVKNLQLLPEPQQAQLLDFLRLAKRRRDREKPVRFVFTVAECDADGADLDFPLLEELLFIVPTFLRIPPLRERKADIEPLARKILLDLTSIYPEYRVRTLGAGVVDWLAGRLWRGNYDEFCSYLRQVIMESPSREITMTYLATRETAFSANAEDQSTKVPLTATTSSNTTTVATLIPLQSATTASPFGEKITRRSAKELLATLR